MRDYFPQQMCINFNIHVYSHVCWNNHIQDQKKLPYYIFIEPSGYSICICMSSDKPVWMTYLWQIIQTWRLCWVALHFHWQQHTNSFLNQSQRYRRWSGCVQHGTHHQLYLARWHVDCAMRSCWVLRSDRMDIRLWAMWFLELGYHRHCRWKLWPCLHWWTALILAVVGFQVSLYRNGKKIK